MSELPAGLRRVLHRSKHAHEPAQARLDAVYERVLRAPAAPSPYDVRPPVMRLGKPWLWIITGGAILMGAVQWLSSPPGPHVASLSAERAPAEPTFVAPAPAQQEPSLRAEIPHTQTRHAQVRLRRAEPQVAATRRAEPVASDVEPTLPGATSPETSRPLPAVARARPVDAEAREDEQPVTATAKHASVQEDDDVEASDTQRLSSRAPRITAARRSSAESLGAEVRLISSARAAIERGDWRAAQNALDAYQIEHAGGQLYAEQRALLARARCLADDLVGARRLYAELVRSAPNSSLVRSVERACPALTR